MDPPKKIRVAENIGDLERIAVDEQMDAALKSKNFTTLCNLEKKIYQEIFNEPFDEELAFIYCLRHQHIMKKIKALDEKFANSRYSQENERVNERLLQLRESLGARYRHLASVSVIDEKDKACVEPPEDSTTMFMNSFIAPRDLYAAMNQYKDLLILDIRTSEQYLMSKIKYGNIINIPHTLITKGLSANKLGDLLSEEARNIWNQRDKYRALIIVDYSIKDVNSDDEPFSILRSVIVNWDINRSYNEHPVILEGGFKDFAEMYPTEVENGYLLVRLKYMELDEVMDDIQNINVDEALATKDSTITILQPKFDNSSDSICDPSMRTISLTRFEDLMDTSPTVTAASGSTDLPSTSYDQPSTSAEHKPPVEPPKFEESSSESSSTSDDDKKTIVLKDILDMQKKIKTELNDDMNLKRKLKPELKKDVNLPPVVDRGAKPHSDQELSPRKPVYGLVGMKNVRNNCYMNACIQALRCVPIIKAFLLSTRARNLMETRNTVLLSPLVYVTRILWHYSGRIYDPSAFRERMVEIRPQYGAGEHEDSCEFLLLVLDKLEIDTSCQFPANYRDTPRQIIYEMKGHAWSYFTDFFYYLIRNDKICSNCKAVSTSYECENTIMLSVPNKNSTIYQILETYFQDTSVQGYKCEQCNRTVTATISKSMDVLPKVLVVALKRYVQKGSTCVKNGILVDIPELSMDLFGNLYELKAIVCHKGTMLIGHYYTIAKMYDQWWEANDDYVHNAKSLSSEEYRSNYTVFFFQLKMN